jgi:hypothetical protein
MSCARPSFATLFGGLDPDETGDESYDEMHAEATSEESDDDGGAETMQVARDGLVAECNARTALLASEKAHAAARLELARATAAADEMRARIHALEREHARELEARATELRAMGEVRQRFLRSLAVRA